jgi:hypothetical protein
MECGPEFPVQPRGLPERLDSIRRGRYHFCHYRTYVYAYQDFHHSLLLLEVTPFTPLSSTCSKSVTTDPADFGRAGASNSGTRAGLKSEAYHPGRATSFPLGTPRCIKTTIHLERTRVSVLHSYTLPSLYRKHQLSGKSQYLRLRWKKGHGRGHRPQQGTGFFTLFRAPTLT